MSKEVSGLEEVAMIKSYMACVDLEKAYDNVSTEKWKVLEKYGAKGKLIAKGYSGVVYVWAVGLV